MKKFQPLLCLLPILGFLMTAQAQVPTESTAPATSTPAAPNSSPSAVGATSQTIDPAKEAEIRKLLELTGTVKMTRQVMAQMISNFRMQNSGVSSEFWDRFEKEMNLQELVDKMVPIYAKYYSLDDLKAVNAFYETPAGQRVLAATPQIMQESMQIGQDWGREVVNRLLIELKEEKEKAAASAAAPSAPPTPAPAPATP
jgi:uncharacterized protein